jgi:DNA transposition AAA+ family ATPase
MATKEKDTNHIASSAHARINIPLNLQNWTHLEEAHQHQLMWFHQHLLDQQMGWNAAQDALGYEKSTIHKVLKGVYGGNWDKICAAIESYKDIVDRRGTIQQNEIVKNSTVKLIHAGLDYAQANNSITMVIGDSRRGKSEAAKLWRDEHNHGRSVYVVAPPIGGTKAFLRRIAIAVGVNKDASIANMYDAICRSFNRNRILIVDEAHRLIPGDHRSQPINLEILRDLHDETHCGLALIATARFDETMKKSEYMYEQVLGRIGMPIRLKKKVETKDIRPIVSQYVAKPSAEMMAECVRIANTQGRLGILVENLKVASRMAGKAKQPLAEEHIRKAIALRRQMSQGEI